MYVDSNRLTAIKLRKEGKSYTDISSLLGISIPKSTMTYWFKDLILPEKAKNEINKRNKEHLREARLLSISSRKKERNKYFEDLYQYNLPLQKMLDDDSVARIALAILYLGEGGKNLRRASIQFSNSDPYAICLFLKLLRQCYIIEEDRFRCTVQCRWGQDEERLKLYWSEVTNVPIKKFYKSRIDPRTINKLSNNKDYKGVCRIDYLSARVFHDILSLVDVLKGARSSIGGASGWQSEG